MPKGLSLRPRNGRSTGADQRRELRVPSTSLTDSRNSRPLIESDAMPLTIRLYHRLLRLVCCWGVWSLIPWLVLSVDPVSAEWVQVAGNDHLGTASYVDSGTIRRNGNTVKMWVLNDYKTEQNVTGDPFLSTKQQVENDCTDERARTLAFTIFSGKRGTRVRWFLPPQKKGSGNRFPHIRIRSTKFCGKLRVARSDRAVHERPTPQTRNHVHRGSDLRHDRGSARIRLWRDRRRDDARTTRWTSSQLWHAR